MVRQWRHATGGTLLEIPAGTLEPDEPPRPPRRASSPRRSGWRRRRLGGGAAFFTAPGFCTELMHTFLATDLTEAAADADEDEDLEPSWLTLDEALAALDDGTIRDGKTHGGGRAGWHDGCVRSRLHDTRARSPGLGRGGRPPLRHRRRPGRHPPPRRQAVPLPRHRRQPDHRRGTHRVVRRARDPAGLDRRLDLPRSSAVTSRPPAATRGVGSSTATTRAGARCATRRSTGASSSSRGRCPASGARPIGTCGNAGCRARRCWPSSSASSRRRSSASATTSTPARTAASASRRCATDTSRCAATEIRFSVPRQVGQGTRDRGPRSPARAAGEGSARRSRARSCSSTTTRMAGASTSHRAT